MSCVIPTATARSWAKLICIYLPKGSIGRSTKNLALTCARLAIRPVFTSPFGRPMRNASALLAISTAGTAGLIRCESCSAAACGSCFCPEWAKGRIINLKFERNRGPFYSRAIPLPFLTSTVNQPHRSPTISSVTNGAIRHGWNRAENAIGRKARSAFTKCISALGGVAPMKQTGI